MKEILNFVVYTWKSWELWQKVLVANIVLQASSWMFPVQYQPWVSGLGWTLLLAVFASWWYKDMLLPKWQAYKQHRNSLLKTIKDSEHA